MGKKLKKVKRGTQKISKKRKNKTERKFNKKKEEDIKERNKTDFYLDDADADLAYDSSELKEESEESSDEDKYYKEDLNEEEISEHGSELDFKEEDYVQSEEEDEWEKNTKNKDKKMSKKELKNLMRKVGNGSEIYITKFLIMVGKLTNPNNELIFDDDGKENVLTKNKVINNLIKYFIIELPNILQLKINSMDEAKNKSNNNLIKK